MENGRMNTTDEILHAELAEIWRDVDKDASVNAAILTGAGGIFSAGGDFSIIQQNIDDFAARAGNGRRRAILSIMSSTAANRLSVRCVASRSGPGSSAGCSPTYR
jgi:enoyl-CoA hydratase/carnithine racemase